MLNPFSDIYQESIKFKQTKLPIYQEIHISPLTFIEMPLQILLKENIN